MTRTALGRRPRYGSVGKTMIGTSAGYRPRTTRETPLENRPDDGDCVVCGNPADGIDAPTRQPICRKCATIRTDGGLLTGGGRYHVVCSDCTFEDLKRERHQAANAVDDHRDDEPSHDVRFEEVRGR